LPLLCYEQEIRNVCTRLAQSLSKSGRRTVAVVDFTDLQGNVTELGRFLAERFSVEFASTAEGFEVVDRTHLKAILQENKLAATGIIDPQTARKLGEIAGVEAIVTGTITPFGDSVNLSVKVLDASTAKMLGAATVDIPRTKAVEDLLGRGVGQTSSMPSSPSTPSGTASPSSSEPDNEPCVAEDNGWLFSLQGCSRSGQEINCDGTVTNRRPETRGFCFYGSREAEVYVDDNQGNRYPINEVFVGRSRTRLWEGKFLCGNLELDLPVRFSMQITGLPVGLPALTLVLTYGEVRKGYVLRPESAERSKVILRNVPIQQR